MWQYLIPFFLTFILAIHYDINCSKGISKKFWLCLLFIYLTCLIGFRYHVGGDSLTYEMVYDNATDLSSWHFTFQHIYQPGFTFLYAVAKSISSDFYVFQLIHVIIINTLLFNFICKNTKLWFLSLFLVEYMMYLYFTTEILRESLAVLVFVYDYKNYHNNKLLKYLIGVLIACCFHISAVVLLFLPLLRHIKLNKKFIIICLGLGMFVYIFNGFFSKFTDNIVGEKVGNYLGGYYGALFTLFSVLRGGVCPLLILLCHKYLLKDNSKYENILCIMVLFGLASTFNPLIFGRTVNYFVLFFILDASYCIHSLIKKHSVAMYHNCFILICILFLSYSSLYFHIHQYKRYIPYSSIFNPIEYERDHMAFEK